MQMGVGIILILRREKGNTTVKDTGAAREPCRKRISSTRLWMKRGDEDHAFTITEDTAFVTQTRAKTYVDLQTRLERAFTDTSTHWVSENHNGALPSLRKLVLVAVPTAVKDETSSSLSATIYGANLFNFHNVHPGYIRMVARRVFPRFIVVATKMSHFG
jgi:hypothetical protein